MPRVTSKSRYVVSDHDLLMALELHIPSMRAIRNTLQPYSAAIASWDKEALKKFDSGFRRGFRRFRGHITDSYVRSCLRRVTAAKLNPDEIGKNFDFYVALEAVWSISMAHKTAIDSFNEYNLAYDTLVPRLAGRLPNSKELDALHRGYGAFNQSIKRLGIALAKVDGRLELLPLGKGTVTETLNLIQEAIVKVTDVRDAMMVLKDAHQKGIEVARGY